MLVPSLNVAIACSCKDRAVLLKQSNKIMSHIQKNHSLFPEVPWCLDLICRPLTVDQVGDAWESRRSVLGGSLTLTFMSSPRCFFSEYGLLESKVSGGK